MYFSKILERLKWELRVSSDKEVAQLLGMSKTAFSERKRRSAFPVDRLLDLKARRPELDLDEIYILTGVKKDDPNRKNVELAQQVSIGVDRSTEGRLSEILAHGLNEVSECSPGGAYALSRAKAEEMKQNLADLILNSSLEEDDLKALFPIIEHISIIKKGGKS